MGNRPLRGDRKGSVHRTNGNMCAVLGGIGVCVRKWSRNGNKDVVRFSGSTCRILGRIFLSTTGLARIMF